MVISRLVILIYFVGLVQCDKLIRFVNCECDVDNEYINLTRCNLKALSREKVVSNIDLYLLKDVKNATGHLSLFKATSTGRYFPFLFNYWGNVCDIIKETPNTNFILRQARRIIAKYSNAVKCYHKVDFYYFRNVEIEYRMIKFFIENGRYKLKLEFYEGVHENLIAVGNYTVVADVTDKPAYPHKRRAKKEKI